MTTTKRFSVLPEVRNTGEPLSDPIYWLGLQWAVTSYGVEARDGGYCIEAERIWEETVPGYGWEQHVGGKEWADKIDFLEALAFARRRWPKGAPIAETVSDGTIPLIEAYMAWCPRNPYTADHPRVGEIVVGTKTGIRPELDGPNRLPSWTGVCATMGRETTPETRVIIMFSNFHALIVRDGIDPQIAHREFSKITEYRRHIVEDAPRS